MPDPNLDDLLKHLEQKYHKKEDAPGDDAPAADEAPVVTSKEPPAVPPAELPAAEPPSVVVADTQTVAPPPAAIEPALAAVEPAPPQVEEESLELPPSKAEEEPLHLPLPKAVEEPLSLPLPKPQEIPSYARPKAETAEAPPTVPVEDESAVPTSLLPPGMSLLPSGEVVFQQSPDPALSAAADSVESLLPPGLAVDESPPPLARPVEASVLPPSSPQPDRAEPAQVPITPPRMFGTSLHTTTSMAKRVPKKGAAPTRPRPPSGQSVFSSASAGGMVSRFGLPSTDIPYTAAAPAALVQSPVGVPVASSQIVIAGLRAATPDEPAEAHFGLVIEPLETPLNAALRGVDAPTMIRSLRPRTGRDVSMWSFRIAYFLGMLQTLQNEKVPWALLAGRKFGRFMQLTSYEQMTAAFKAMKVGVLDIESSPVDMKVHVLDCMLCAGLWKLEEPVCALVGGMLAAAVQQISGKEANAKETSCMAMGHAACTFNIEYVRAEIEMPNG